MSWVYVLELVGGRIYVGYSDNVARRIQQHIDGRGAQATKQAPVVDIYSITKFKTREDALLGEKEEYRKQCELHGKHKVSMGQKFRDLVSPAKLLRRRNWVPRYVFEEYFLKKK
jgi:putative endonuclease